MLILNTFIHNGNFASGYLNYNKDRILVYRKPPNNIKVISIEHKFKMPRKLEIEMFQKNKARYY